MVLTAAALAPVTIALIGNAVEFKLPVSSPPKVVASLVLSTRLSAIVVLTAAALAPVTIALIGNAVEFKAPVSSPEVFNPE